ncbi:MAG: dockerin type I domain-containing protein [Oscillospiraceae bacterium]|nr:dockerin type I domain-containing protein [Oscillospiraceae bacterium]
MRKIKTLISVLCVVACLMATNFIPAQKNLVSASNYSTSQLTELYPEDFGISNGRSTDWFYAPLKNGGSLLNTIFTVDFKHSGTDYWFIYAASETWKGLNFSFENGNLYLRDLSNTLFNGEIETLSCEIAGVNFSEEFFRFQISIEPYAYHSDGVVNDIKVGIYFNYKLYDDKYFYLPNTLDKLGNAISSLTKVYGGNKRCYVDFYSPIRADGEKHIELTPSDIGFEDGYVNGSKDIGMDIGNKLLSTSLALNNTDNYFDYAGIKFSTDTSGGLVISDSNGKCGFETTTKYPNSSLNLNNIVPADVGMSNKLVSSWPVTYKYNANTFSGGGVYQKFGTLTNTYFAMKINPVGLGAEGTKNYIDLRHACSSGGWEGLITHIYDDKIKLISVYNSHSTFQEISVSDIEGISSFNNATFTLGISLRYCDFDCDGDYNDVQVGIWINEKLAQNKYVYLPDVADKLGNEIHIYVPDSTQKTKVSVYPTSSSIVNNTQISGLDTAFTTLDLEIATKASDFDFDGKSDLKADIFVDGDFYRTIIIADYKSKLTNTLSVNAYVKSKEKRISYSSEVFSDVDFNSSGNIATSQYILSDEKIFSSNLSLKDINSKFNLNLSQANNVLSFADFGIADGTYNHTTRTSGNIGASLNKNCFSGKFNFTGSTYFYFAGTSAYNGITFDINSGSLRIRDAAGNLVTRIFPKNAGIQSFISTEFVLGLSLYINDTDSDDASDDVSLGVWFNGVYYNSFDIKDAALSVGGYISLDSAGPAYNITVATNIAKYDDANLPFAPPQDDIINLNITRDSNNPVISGLFEKTLTDVSSNGEFAIDLEAKAVNLDNDFSNDLSVKVYINGKQVNKREYFIKDVASDKDLSKVTLTITNVNVDTSSRLPEDSLDYELYNLHEGDFWLIADGEVMINREGGHFTNEKISTPGEYVIVRKYHGKEFVQKVQLWKGGYLNSDNNIDILDFIVAKKYMAGFDTAEYKCRGADTNFDGEVTPSDMINIKRMVLGLENPPVYTNYDKYSTVGKTTMPIVGFHGPVAPFIYRENVGTDENPQMKDYLTNNLITKSVYKAIADLGINMISYIENSGFSGSTEENFKLAEEYGIAINLHYREPGASDLDFANYIGHVGNYTSFKGLHVVDEPNTLYYPSASTTERMSGFAADSVRANKFCNLYGYTNLLPMYAWMGIEGATQAERNANYVKYLEEYCETYKPKMISWDHYVYSTGDKYHYFNNMNMVKAAAAKYNLPFWGFVQAGDDSGRMQNPTVVTESQMLWNVNTQLAYGVKGMQYFTLIQPYYFSFDATNDTVYDFNQSGLIAANGTKTKYYSMAKKANDQIIAVDEYLMEADSKAVLAVGTNTQADTACNLTSYGAVSSVVCDNNADGAIVGCFDYKGKQAFYIVNYDSAAAQNITLHFNNTYNLKVVSSVIDTIVSSNQYTATLGAGQAVLVVLN